ncbi:MAG: hypothetical protein NWS56_05410 [Haliea sp.]|jgi:septation ring formation regulator EzrA|nr:hypothetical protein [Haliea sp.]
MSQPLFDVLTYSREIEAAGLTRQQADVIARGMATMVSQQLDTLVTTEHFDRCMSQIDVRFEHSDLRFESINKQFDSIEKRFDSIDQRFDSIDQRFESIDKRFEKVDERFERVDEHFVRVEGRLMGLERSQSAQTALLTITTLAVVIPLIQSLTGS